MKNQFKVEELKTRIDRYLANQLPSVSRSQIQREIEAGLVLVNGKVVKESKFVVRKGDNIRYKVLGIERGDKGIKATNIPLKVLYDNHGLLIIDKPAGLTVHPGAGFKGETLASALLYQFSPYGRSPEGGKGIHLVGEEHRPGIVHRLDKDTSGVILVAKTQEMYEYLKDAFRNRRIKKEYIALVSGRVEKPHGFIETPIGKSKVDFRKYDTKHILEPKESLTEYKVLEYLEGFDPVRSHPAKGTASAALGRFASNGVDQYTLLLVKLHTGRTHQIRVHFKSINHPLMGDSLYGGKLAKLAGLQRQFLHAARIEVRLPASSPEGSQGGPDGTWIEAESELPSDLREVLTSLNSKIVNQL